MLNLWNRSAVLFPDVLSKFTRVSGLESALFTFAYLQGDSSSRLYWFGYRGLDVSW